MNEVKVYTVKDQKAQIYAQPFFAVNDAVALRLMTQAVNEEGHQFNRNAEDYTVWCIGLFNAQEGVLQVQTPVCIAKCWDLVELSQERI